MGNNYEIYINRHLALKIYYYFLNMYKTFLNGKILSMKGE